MGEQPETSEKDQYLLGRSDIETKRLNEQHEFSLIMSKGHFVHPSVPLETLSSVADIGTGTGIWLKDVESHLSKNRSSSSPPLRLDGFDISDAAFPKTDVGKRNFYVHNVLHPFPEKFHGQYDLVHMRYLSWAFKKEEYTKVAGHIAQLLKPGGYYTWNDADNRDIIFFPDNDAALAESLKVLGTIPISQGMTQKPSPLIQDAFKAIGLQDIKVEECDHVPPADARETARMWYRGSFKTVAARSLKITGEARDEEEAEKLAREKLELIDGFFFGKGYYPTFELKMVVGRKPL